MADIEMQIDYDEVLVCAECGKEIKRGEKAHLSTLHGAVRSVLCEECNSEYGM